MGEDYGSGYVSDESQGSSDGESAQMEAIKKRRDFVKKFKEGMGSTWGRGTDDKGGPSSASGSTPGQ